MSPPVTRSGLKESVFNLLQQDHTFFNWPHLLIILLPLNLWVPNTFKLSHTNNPSDWSEMEFQSSFNFIVFWCLRMWTVLKILIDHLYLFFWKFSVQFIGQFIECKFCFSAINCLQFFICSKYQLTVRSRVGKDFSAPTGYLPILLMIFCSVLKLFSFV